MNYIRAVEKRTQWMCWFNDARWHYNVTWRTSLALTTSDAVAIRYFSVTTVSRSSLKCARNGRTSAL